jgi:hypothetical protein
MNLTHGGAGSATRQGQTPKWIGLGHPKESEGRGSWNRLSHGVMPIFFFDVYDDLGAIDEEGVNLPSVAAARRMAIKSARCLAAEQVRNGRLALNHGIEVRDGRKAVFTVRFADAVAIEP